MFQYLAIFKTLHPTHTYHRYPFAVLIGTSEHPTIPLRALPWSSLSHSHSTRRACSLLLSPGAREAWSTTQVMKVLSSLRLTSRVSSLLTV